MASTGIREDLVCGGLTVLAGLATDHVRYGAEAELTRWFVSWQAHEIG